MTRARRLAIIAPLAIIGGVLFVFIGGQLVMRLWNWLLPPLFGWKTLTFWQALGLLVLSRILFGGLGVSGGSQGGYRTRMRERWGRMTPEERERARHGWRGRWGFVPPESPGEGAGGPTA